MRVRESGRRTLAQGWRHFLADVAAGRIRRVDEDAFEVGVNIATTPGAVIYRNELIELIQYTPTTKVHEIPLVIVVPWINKYYILDINQRLSLVRYLVAQGFTVFVTRRIQN